MLARRLVSLPILLLVTLVTTTLFPILLVAAVLVSLIPSTRGALPTLGFIVSYLWCEVIGVICLFWVWVRHRDPRRALGANRLIQRRWALALLKAATICYRITFKVTGEGALPGAPAIVLPRHSSIADTIVPIAFYTAKFDYHVRYVLKRELLWDPCLDIAGNRLPNFFVDRSGQDSQSAVAGVSELTRELEQDESLVIFLEGTRYSPAKHDALRGKQNPDLIEQLDRWPQLLPPRTGGVGAVIENNPNRDILFICHTGFDNSAGFSTLINGSWYRADIRIHFWRVSFAEIGDDPRAFLFEEWDRMQLKLNELNSSTGNSP